MLRKFVKSKLHGLKITEANLEYEGSLGIDLDVLDAADLFPGELILVANLNNGIRFNTYLIAEDRGSGKVTLNGAAARLGNIGDRIIVMNEILLNENEIDKYNMKVLHFNDRNEIV